MYSNPSEHIEAICAWTYGDGLMLGLLPRLPVLRRWVVRPYTPCLVADEG